MKFDWTINIGTIVSLVTFAVLMGGFFMRLSGYLTRHEVRLANLELKIDMLWEWFRKQVRDINGRPLRDD